MDNRFILLVSVGLIVRAPSPVEGCAGLFPGISDIRLLDDDEGVPVRRAGDLPGDRPVAMKDDRDRP
jgi:hypothetical protein